MNSKSSSIAEGFYASKIRISFSKAPHWNCSFDSGFWLQITVHSTVHIYAIKTHRAKQYRHKYTFTSHSNSDIEEQSFYWARQHQKHKRLSRLEWSVHTSFSKLSSQSHCLPHQNFIISSVRLRYILLFEAAVELSCPKDLWFSEPPEKIS